MHPDGDALERLMVNHIRHELTSYDAPLAELFGRIGKEAAIVAVRRKVYAAIVAVYPTLAAGCGRQLAQRTEPAMAERLIDLQGPREEASTPVGHGLPDGIPGAQAKPQVRGG